VNDATNRPALKGRDNWGDGFASPFSGLQLIFALLTQGGAPGFALRFALGYFIFPF
jgi:hypothetical protein